MDWSNHDLPKQNETMRYIINKNKQPTGEHEVHTTLCDHLPLPVHQIAIGDFYNCQSAIAFAKVQYPGAIIDGCYYCCNACHTR